MPKYTYVCSNCKIETTLYHSMNEQIEDCSSCDQNGVLKKIPVSFSLEHKEKEARTGDIVESTIKECYNELQQEKDKLKSKFYGKDE